MKAMEEQPYLKRQIGHFPNIQRCIKQVKPIQKCGFSQNGKLQGIIVKSFVFFIMFID